MTKKDEKRKKIKKISLSPKQKRTFLQSLGLSKSDETRTVSSDENIAIQIKRKNKLFKSFDRQHNINIRSAKKPRFPKVVLNQKIIMQFDKGPEIKLTPHNIDSMRSLKKELSYALKDHFKNSKENSQDQELKGLKESKNVEELKEIKLKQCKSLKRMFGRSNAFNEPSIDIQTSDDEDVHNIDHTIDHSIDAQQIFEPDYQISVDSDQHTDSYQQKNLNSHPQAIQNSYHQMNPILYQQIDPYSHQQGIKNSHQQMIPISALPMNRNLYQQATSNSYQQMDPNSYQQINSNQYEQMNQNLYQQANSFPQTISNRNISTSNDNSPFINDSENHVNNIPNLNSIDTSNEETEHKTIVKDSTKVNFKENFKTSTDRQEFTIPDSARICRICKLTTNDQLIQPCACKDENRWAHSDCLAKQMEQTREYGKCKKCNGNFNTDQFTIIKKRRSCFEFFTYDRDNFTLIVQIPFYLGFIFLLLALGVVQYEQSYKIVYVKWTILLVTLIVVIVVNHIIYFISMVRKTIRKVMNFTATNYRVTIVPIETNLDPVTH